MNTKKTAAAKDESWYSTIVNSKEWGKWEKEQRKRFRNGEKFGYEGCFDIDESRECGLMSENHWQSFISFIKTL